MVTTPCFHCRGCRLDPWSPGQGTKIPHAGVVQPKKKKRHTGYGGRGCECQLGYPISATWTLDKWLPAFQEVMESFTGGKAWSLDLREGAGTDQTWPGDTWTGLMNNTRTWVKKPSTLGFLTSEKWKITLYLSLCFVTYENFWPICTKRICDWHRSSCLRKHFEIFKGLNF